MNGLTEKDSRKKVVITGAAGLVGQNLLTVFADRSDLDIVAIDKHSYNMEIVKQLHPAITTVTADLLEPEAWKHAFDNADVVIALHAQITGKTLEPFTQNNIEATKNMLEVCKEKNTPFIIHASSSVVNSVAEDDYTTTKIRQEELVKASGIDYCVLRPTLMFGWFDPKHLGWLARFMQRVPVFPVPGDGKYLRQPLYNRDFCKAIEVCMDRKPVGQIYDLVGHQKICYIDMIRAIKKVKKLHTIILPIPVGLFHFLLKTYALFSKRPPFTSDQLTALTAGDIFEGVDIREVFGFEPTAFQDAIEETFLDSEYSHIVLKPYL